MTNEEIIKGLQAVNEHIGKHFNEGGAWMAEFIDNAIKALDSQRWIPVSERLPEEEGLYLVSVKNDHERRYSKTCWYHGDGNWFALQNVEAWMPLPEPYRESEE